MTTTRCPDCHDPVTVHVNAREGRCAACRPEPRRRHSVARLTNAQQALAELADEHDRLWSQ